ncbi:MAG: hypothetical protein JWM09_1066 [Francisellaceae bacterium]|nr:hypothetical protein [Francisellaceae bacterium]
MIANFFKRHVFYPLLIILIGLTILISTELGLKSLIQCLRLVTPGILSIGQIKGNLIDGAHFEQLHYQDTQFNLEIEQSFFNLDLNQLLFLKLNLFDFWVQQLNIATKDNLNIKLEKLSGSLSHSLISPYTEISIHNIQGNIQEKTILGFGQFGVDHKNYFFKDLLLNLGEYQFKITPRKQHETSGQDWSLKTLNDEFMNIQLNGILQLKSDTKSQNILIDKGLLQHRDLGEWNLISPSSLTISKDIFSLEPMQWENAQQQARISIDIHRNPIEGWEGNANLAELKLASLNTLLNQNVHINGSINGHLSLSFKPKHIPIVAGEIIVSPGSLQMVDKTNKVSKFPFNGGKIKIITENENLFLNLNLEGPGSSNIKGFLNTLNLASIKNDWRELKINTEINCLENNFYWLTEFWPDVNNFKGNFIGSFKAKGLILSPEWLMDLKLNNSNFNLPRQGITIRNFNVNLTSETDGIFKLQGRGQSGSGNFNVNGQAQPFLSNAPYELNIKGKNIQLINSKAYQIIATMDLKLNLENYNNLNITGNINVPAADINIQEGAQQIVLTHDIIFTDINKPLIASDFKINPNIALRLENNVNIKGHGLNAKGGGKIKIEQYSNGFLFGSGRITLKEGNYRMNGQMFYIDHGRLIFQPITLLTNPTIDIKLIPKPKAQDDKTDLSEIGLSVQGTLLAPNIIPFSSENLSDNEILQRLGFANPFTVIMGNANMSNNLMEKFQKGLGFDVSIETSGMDEESLGSVRGIQDPNDNNAVLTLGKRLSNRWQLLLLQNTMDATHKAKLKYLISPRFSLGTEYGTEGVGADITYSVEKD